jgi:hypothetical protein
MTLETEQQHLQLLGSQDFLGDEKLAEFLMLPLLFENQGLQLRPGQQSLLHRLLPERQGRTKTAL